MKAWKSKGRYHVYFNKRKMPMAHYVWMLNYPNNPILPGEVIHHGDGNKKNDCINNLYKMTDFDHRSLHSKIEINTLLKWRKENPEKVSEISKKSMAVLREKIKNDPEFAKELKRKQREGTIKSNKARKGEKRSKEFCEQKSKFWKKYWSDPENRKKNKGKSKFSKPQVLEIRQLLFEKVPMQKIANQFNVACSTIHNIKSNKTYTDI